MTKITSVVVIRVMDYLGLKQIQTSKEKYELIIHICNVFPQIKIWILLFNLFPTLLRSWLLLTLVIIYALLCGRNDCFRFCDVGLAG